MLWSWSTQPSLDREIGFTALQQDSNGRWVYCTNQGEYDETNALKRQPKFIIRDSNFEIEEKRFLDQLESFDDFAINLIPLSNGDWLLLGQNNEKISQPAPGSADNQSYAWMCRLSPDGDTLWQRKDLLFPDTPYFTQQYLIAAGELPSGSIIAAGNYHTPIPHQYGIIIKVGTDGCIDILNCPPGLETGNSEPQPEDLLSPVIFPNPATDFIQIRQNNAISTPYALRLYDTYGHLLYSAKELHEETYSMSIQHLPAGTYLLEIRTGQQRKMLKLVVAKE